MNDQNTNGPTAAEDLLQKMLDLLPEDRRAIVKYGEATFQKTADECDRLTKRVAELEREVAQYKLEHDSLHDLLSAMEERLSQQQTAADSRVAGYQVERDQAVSEREKAKAALMAVRSVLLTFEVPSAPLIRPVEGDDRPDHAQETNLQR